MKKQAGSIRAALRGFTAFLLSAIAALGITLGDTFREGTFPVYAPHPQAEETIRVLSFNVRCTGVNGVPAPLRRGIVADEVRAIAPDSFGVQEATTLWMQYLRDVLPDYAAVGQGRNGGSIGEHSAVLYRCDRYDLVDSGTFWLSETPEKPSKALDAAHKRVCTWAVLENKETKQRYAHVNSHFDHIGEAARVFEANMVAAFIEEKFADLPVVFTADMNCKSSEETYAIRTRTMQDTSLTADTAEAFGTFHNGHPEKSAKTIDFILCSDAFHAVAYQTVTAGIDGRLVSDHFPIYADLAPV